MSKKKIKKTKRKIKKPLLLTSIINILITLITIFFVHKLNVLPLKYFLIICFVLLDINLIVMLFMILKKKIFKIIGIIITVIFSIGSIFGIYYLSKANDFLNKSFNNHKNTYKVSYYLVALNNSNLETLEDLKNKKIGYYDNIPNIEEALKQLNDKVKIEKNKFEDSTKTFEALDSKEIDAVLIENSLYAFLIEYDKNIKDKNYKTILSFDVEIEEENEKKENNTDSFNIYIGGTDFTNLNTDFNMIVTINKKTHKVLLTSTPRDFYVELDGKNGQKDLLGYAGVWGINTSRKTIEKLYGVNIDYHVKINTNSLVKLVDTLGGIEFCSDKSFTTTHALVQDTYDDTKGKKLNVKKGCYKYNGIEILTIARERLAFKDGDRQRQKNCQAIMISIFNKIASAEIITNYSNILNAVSDLYTTNISKDIVTSLARDIIQNGNKWDIEQQSVTGSDSRGYVHLSKILDYVMIPDENSVKQASNKIKEIMNN